MSKKFLVSIDMNGNEVQNAVSQNLAVSPSNPKEGQHYYNTVDKKEYYWNGTAWVEGGGGGSGTVTSVGLENDTDGGLTVSGSPITSSGTIKVKHTNILPSAQETEAVYPIKIDKNGHVSSYGNGYQVGGANGLATLGGDGKVPSSQLPSYVDDVISLLTISDTAPTTYVTDNKYYNSTSKKLFTAVSSSDWGTGADPEDGKIYVTKDTNLSYRWSGTDLVRIDASTIHKFVGTCTGDNTTTAFTINHSLGTTDVIVNVYDATTYEDVMVDIVRTSTSAITVTFAVAPISAQNYKVVIIA